MQIRLALLLTLLILSSSLILESEKLAVAQIIPPIPEFSLKLEDYSYEVKPTYTTDPYTGNTVVNTEGYNVGRKFVAVVIKNTVSPSFYAVVNSSVVKLYYQIRIKGHSQDWVNATYTKKNLAPSEENYTTIKFGLGSVDPDPGGYSIWIGNSVSGNNQIDVQVQGINGYYTNRTSEEPPCWRIEELSLFHETGRSDWSTTQTITISNDQGSTPTPVESANISLETILIILAVVIALLLTTLLLTLFFPKKWKRQFVL